MEHFCRFSENYVNLEDFYEILVKSYIFCENHIFCKIYVKTIIFRFFMSKTSMCKIHYKIQWNIDEIWSIFILFAFFALFPNSAPFAYFHQILHISSFFTFSPNSASFIDFRTFSLQCATCEICFVFPMKLEPFLVIFAHLGGNH